MTGRALVMLVSGCCLLTATGPARGADDAPPDLGPLLTEVRDLLRKHYPKAVVTRTGDAIHFEFHTRQFQIHEALLTGEWQDAREETGPQKGGIYGDIELQRGPYQGMAVVPQSFDKRYFILSLTAPYSRKLDHHLVVRLKSPRDVPREFLREFERLVGEFDRHVVPPGK